MNIANKLTMLRIVLTGVFMLFLLWWQNIWWTKVVSLLVFSFAAISDYFDGMIAKKRNMITDFGRLMDPIADKILVLAAFLAFVEMELIPAWMVVVVIFREMAVTGLRVLALTKGRVIAAGDGGKHKMVSQVFAIVAIVAVLVFAKVFNALPALTGTANTTVFEFADNFYSGIGLLGVALIVLGAVAIIAVIYMLRR